jgi:hypothetical protein
LHNRIWWTSDDVPDEAPVASPNDDETLDFHPPEAPHPFSVWCARRFLNEETGTALLTFPTIRIPEKFPGGWSEYFRDRYPQIAVVDTAYANLVCVCGFRALSAEVNCPRCGRQFLDPWTV